MYTFLLIVHVVTCFFLVVLVLVQSGKGAEISASFAGSSQTVFGSSGGANFFTRATGIAAAIFMVTSLLLTLSFNKQRKSVFEGVNSTPVQTAPAQSAPAQSAPAQNAPAAPAQK